MEHLVIVAAAIVVTTEQLRMPIISVRVQDEIKAGSFLLQHNVRGLWSEAFHGCHNCKKHGQMSPSCIDIESERLLLGLPALSIVEEKQAEEKFRKPCQGRDMIF
jgi:hypothetical protein